MANKRNKSLKKIGAEGNSLVLTVGHDKNLIFMIKSGYV